jgi:hypothetical protein
MSRLWIAVPVLVLLAPWGGSLPAQAGPCTTQISQLEQQISKVEATAPPGSAGEPSAPQSIDAQLHHQPTPGSVQSAARAANADGRAALDRAHRADAAGDAGACAKALTEARALYGVP